MGSSVSAGFIKSKQLLKSPDLHISLILFSGDKAGTKTTPMVRIFNYCETPATQKCR